MRATLCVALLLLTGTAFTQAAETDDWKLEVLHLKNGRTLRGLIAQDTPQTIRFEIVRPQPGRPTVHFLTTVPRSEIKQIDALPAKERAAVVARLQNLNPPGQVEDLRLRRLELKPAFLQVIGFERKKALSYFADHFELTSNANEEIVRRTALRLEQVFTAYAHFFPPANRPVKTNTMPTIVLFQSAAEYQATLKGRNIFNPAHYEPANNELYAGAELHALGDKLEELRKHRGQELERIKRQELDILKLPKGEVRDRAQQQLQEARRELTAAADRNEELFRQATRALFHSLQHEAFHAYLGSFVFPSDKGELPRWLNEGLAQIFETAIGKDGVLQLGTPDPARLELAQAAVGRGELVPLMELVKAGSGPFVLPHGQDRQTAERY